MAEKKKAGRRNVQRGLICEGLSFAASEAYKLLRTNLLFSLPEKGCHIIGVTSSVRGEGKSTTSINLSYTIAQSGKRVLLIDADMRIPSVAIKLDLNEAPGLSNLIAGMHSEGSCMRQSNQLENWYILPAGDIPPNPSELLGSERMHTLGPKQLRGVGRDVAGGEDVPVLHLVRLAQAAALAAQTGNQV